MSLDDAAENALVGALLLRPGQLDDVRAWLQTEDICGTAPQQAYAAMVELRKRDEDVSPQSVDTEVRVTVALGTQAADAAYLVTAIQSTPCDTRATTYGRMVLELSIRRHVAEDAIRLRQAGESARTSDQLNRLFATVDGMRRGVELLHRRESAAAGALSVAPAIGGELDQLTFFPRSEYLPAEKDLIYSVVEQPSSLSLISAWLRTGDFSDDECGALFGELTALHDARNPIDRLTLAWRAAKVGIQGPVTESLVTAVVEAPRSSLEPVAAARRVLEQSVQSAVLATSEELERVSHDPGVNATSLAYARLNNLWPQQRRLVRATLTCP